MNKVFIHAGENVGSRSGVSRKAGNPPGVRGVGASKNPSGGTINKQAGAKYLGRFSGDKSSKNKKGRKIAVRNQKNVSSSLRGQSGSGKGSSH